MTTISKDSAEAIAALQMDAGDLDEFGLAKCDVYVSEGTSTPLPAHFGGGAWKPGRIKGLVVAVEFDDGTRCYLHPSRRQQIRVREDNPT